MISGANRDVGVPALFKGTDSFPDECLDFLGGGIGFFGFDIPGKVFEPSGVSGVKTKNKTK